MNRRTYGIVLQLVVLITLACFVLFIVRTTSHNLAAAGITTGFRFLSQPAGFDIGFSFIPYDSSDSYLWVFVIGILNTLFVTALSIVACTCIGFLVGIAQLSTNKLTAFMAKMYVEAIRNIPLLLHVVFWYFIILNVFPAVAQSWTLLDLTFVNNRGLYLPAVDFGLSTLVWVSSFVAIALLSALIMKRNKRYYEQTGKRKTTLPAILALFLVTGLSLYAGGMMDISVELPTSGRFNISGGTYIVPELFALVIGLSLYHGAFVAEYVRAGILSVNKGQSEAAYSFGMTRWRTMREIIIPQAMRVIIPSYINNSLNVFKNSSLGAAIAFPELVNVFLGTTLNQTGNAVEIVCMAILFYFSISMLISGVLNLYNHRVQIVER
jgi:general L-amino acid transport system permease protein